MSNMFVNSMFFASVLTIGAYCIGIFIQKKLKLKVINPMIISMLLIICLLKLTGVTYAEYEKGTESITYFLTPATVALAIPLYRQLELLKKHLAAILIGIVSGVLSSLVSVFLFALGFGMTHEQYVTMLPKSITMPIGIGLSEELGGVVAITIVTIVITGITGNALAEQMCKWFRIQHPVAKGVAIGTSSHALGTAKALQIGEIEGAMSSLAIAVAGLCTVVFASFFAMFL